MSPELEIIIPIRDPDERLVRTVASLASQTDRQFSVLLGDNCSASGQSLLKSAQEQLAAAGIPARRVEIPGELRRLEHWNLTHARARGDWLKPLPPGGELKPTYIEALKQRILQQPQARVIRCDVEVWTEWGPESVHAPFPQGGISPAGFLNYFPMRIRWLATASNVAFHRVAWLASGGFSIQFPGCAFLNLNVILALHYGLENIHETLAIVDANGELPLSKSTGCQPSFWLELWLILRQARNYCLAAKLPWSKKWLFLRAMNALGH